MSKWKCKICGKEFDNFHAQGFDNKIHCPLCFFKIENRNLRQRMDKINEYLNNLRTYHMVSEIRGHKYKLYVCEQNFVHELLSISKGDEE